jgi:crossover junction endodeoxyribonuclease RusA
MKGRIVLPYPPSANRYWKTFAYLKGWRPLVNVTPSAEAREYRERVKTILQRSHIQPAAGEVELEMTFYRPRRRGDLDNRLKVLLDALEGCLYFNDEQIVRITAIRKDDKEHPRVEIMFNINHMGALL